jgi:hypothetical protein
LPENEDGNTTFFNQDGMADYKTLSAGYKHYMFSKPARPLTELHKDCESIRFKIAKVVD